MLQSKLVTNVDIPEMYPQLKVIQKSMVVDSSPKLTRNDWIKEQSEDSDINLIGQLLKFDKLKKYVAREMDSSRVQVLLKCHKDLFLRNGLLYQSFIKEPSRTNLSICATQEYCSQSDLGGWKEPWVYYKKGSFGPKWQMMCVYTYAHVIDV